MKVTNLDIEGLKIIEPDRFGDDRGFFMETFNSERYKEAGINDVFIQDNMSKSNKGVLRGLHWQDYPNCQSKLVWVVKGCVWDFAVDIRHCSKTFGHFYAVKLDDKNPKQFYIPKGFAHGFLCMEDDTLFCYKCDNLYHKESERGIRFDDPDIGIDLSKMGINKMDLIISEKDKVHPYLKEIKPYSAYECFPI